MVTTRVLSTLHTRLRVRRAPGIPTPSFFLGERFVHNSGATRRGNADTYSMNTNAPLSLSIVIAAKSGRSSIPETPTIELRSRGVLDTPTEPVIGLAKGETRWRGMTL